MKYDRIEFARTVLVYRRMINTIELIIVIDENLHDEHSQFFNCIFFTYRAVRAYEWFNSASMVYITPTSKLPCIPDSVKIISCDTSSERWMFSLIGSLEEWYAERLGCTVIHGSLINLHNKNVLLVGKRMAGKTTLTGYLSIHEGARYLDDDCIYVLNKQYWGFNMPISLRINVDSLSHESAIGYTYDGETYRTMFSPKHMMGMVPGVDVVVFPEYAKEDNCSLVKIDAKDAFNRIINQIRHSRDPQILFKDVLQLIKNSMVYSLKYNCSQSALALLESILR